MISLPQSALQAGRMARALMAAALLIGCRWSDSGVCDPLDKACIVKAYQNHPARKRSSWKLELDKPRAQRVGPAPQYLLDYIAMGNIVGGYPERPRPAVLETAFMTDVNAALAGIPAEVLSLVDGSLVGIYFVEQLGGTGMTDYVLDDDGKPAGAFIILDVGVLRRLTANAWATWKENTPFQADPSGHFKLNATIEMSDNDNRIQALQYILLHEIGHVLSVGRSVHPDWTSLPSAEPVVGTYPFFDLSWRVDLPAKRYASRFDTTFAERRQVSYYWNPQLPASSMQAAYGRLASTNFPTLYAATTPGDDFAESFVSYVHVVRMGKPWSIRVQREGGQDLVFDACWNEARCAQKRALLDQLLARPIASASGKAAR